MANRIGVTPAQISKYENGDSNPKLETIIKIAEILGVLPGELLDKDFISLENHSSMSGAEYRTDQYEVLTSKIIALEKRQGELEKVIRTLTENVGL